MTTSQQCLQQAALQIAGAFTLSMAQASARSGSNFRNADGRSIQLGEGTAPLGPVFFCVMVAMISDAASPFCKMIACRFRPRAASIAATNFGSTSSCATSAPADDRLEYAGIVQAFQNRLRTLGQTFALFVQLLQNFEARLLFRQRAFNRDQFSLRIGE